MFNAARSESREEKRLFILIGFYPLSIVVFGLVQTFILNAPLFCFGCTIIMLFFYIQSMQMQISVDSLTKLNNRGQIMRYMDRIKYSENESCYVVMIDINRFMQINDSYGHMEGDRALTIVADSLIKYLFETYPDTEWLLPSKGDNSPIRMHRFNDNLKKICEKVGVKYFSSHGIRFHNISALYDADISEKEIQRLSGHTTSTMTRYYNRSIKKYDENDKIRDVLG